jgi:hypothetical protein
MSSGTAPPTEWALSAPSSTGAEPRPPAARSGPSPRRAATGLVIVAVLVAVVLVMLLIFTGALSATHSTGGTTPGASGALSFQHAEPISGRAANSSAGAPWTLVLASGLLPLAAATANATSSGSSSCNLTLFPGVPSRITTEPGGKGSVAGTATTWLFLYRNASGAVLAVAVLNGTALPIGTIASGQDCSVYFGFLDPIPATVLDSTVLASDVAASAATFLAAHANVSAVYAIVGGVSVLGHTVGPEWELNYTTCPIGSAGHFLGASFNATVNAETGAVLYSQSIPSLVCPASGNVTVDVAGSAPASWAPASELCARRA